MSADSPPRKPLHERSDSDSNANRKRTLRLVPSDPPRLLSQGEPEFFGRTALPTHPSHILSPGKSARGKGKGVDVPPIQYETSKAHPTTNSSASSPAHSPTVPQPSHNVESQTGPRPRPVPKKKRLHVHKDKTFSLVAQDDSSAIEDWGPQSPALSSKSSYDFLSQDQSNAKVRSNSTASCIPALSSTNSTAPSTPVPESKQPISVDPITNSPWNYQFVGGLRKVHRSSDLKQKVKSELPPLPDLPEVSDVPTSHNLSAKHSFQSTATTTSENTNYKLYRDRSSSDSEAIPAPPSSSDSNYHLLGDPSPSSSRGTTVIHRAISENENYEIHGDPSPSPSFADLPRPAKYSQESLVVAPLKPRARGSNEHLGYYKSRSRESLRTGSLTSISTVLSQQEASRAIVGSGSLINLPVLAAKIPGTSSWAESFSVHPLRYHMNEQPHQWSSQLSTVHSVSDGGTDRRSSGFPSTPSRHSRQMLSISSSLAAQEDAGSRSESLEPPQPTFGRNGQRHMSSSSIRMVEDQDEYGDGITDMQDLRARPSRTRLSGFFSITSSDNGRTNTMRSTTSSRANSMLANSIEPWARLYYSGERRFLGAPGSSTEGSESRASSFRTGSPNTDHFPLSIYSPRRRPREINNYPGPRVRGSLEITPAPQLGSDGEPMNDPYSRRFRTWSMSSIWSPHLRLDRRATRHSMWDPPSINWSTEGSWFGRRNVQILMFIAGFIFPFAWIISALLPLPKNPMSQMQERDHSTSNLESPNGVSNDYARRFGPMDEARYESARWWRNLNRWMSLVGLLIIAAVVALVVVSIKEKW